MQGVHKSHPELSPIADQSALLLPEIWELKLNDWLTLSHSQLNARTCPSHHTQGNTCTSLAGHGGNLPAHPTWMLRLLSLADTWQVIRKTPTSAWSRFVQKRILC